MCLWNTFPSLYTIDVMNNIKLLTTWKGKYQSTNIKLYASTGLKQIQSDVM